MIQRYTLPEMGAIWTDQAKYQAWLRVELAACRAWNRLGRIPDRDLAEIEAKAAFETRRVDEIEKETKHDVIAFLTNVAEHVGPASRFIHLGMTSSDVLDTAYALQLVQAADLILAALDRLLDALRKRAFEHKRTLMIGRSHGIHAEPVTFGLKLAGFYAEFQRDRSRLEQARRAAARGKISGAVGTYAHLPPELETMVMEELGLEPAVASTQVVSRDGLAEYFCALAVLGGGIERLAVEIRHLQRTEVLEAEEFFRKGQKGSSAMPHKRNPILSENLCGLARLVRGYLVPALENDALWHERDISHSSVERVIVPDATTAADFMLRRLIGLLDKLVVYPERMEKNLNLLRGLMYSQPLLLALTEKGLARQEAYVLVQRCAMEVWQDESKTFKETVLADSEITKHFMPEELERIFDLSHYLRHVDTIFQRVFE